MSSSRMTDVIVIGGGPAGSSAATFLAKKGHRVTVLEKEKFPRDHVGESLLPYCYGVFKKLGVLEEMKQRYVRKPGVRFLDVDGKRYTTWCFGHVLKDASQLSFHVIRAEFDKMLLDNSRRNGVTVHEQTRVVGVDLDSPEQAVVRANGPNGEKEFKARFVIDASGRDTFIASRLKCKKPHPDLDRTALSTHWLGAKFTGGIEEGLLQICYLGGEKKGWIWVIPVNAERLSIGVVLNHDYLRAQKDAMTKRGVVDWKRELYLQELNSSEFVRGIIDGARTAMPLMFNGDYSYWVDGDRKWGKNYAMIGDASAFIDPIFASGVYLSMNTAYLVSEALSKKLKSKNGAGDEAIDAAYDTVNGAYKLVDKAIRMFYNPHAINWAQAGEASALIHARYENAMALGHYLLAGDFFEKHKEYSEFIDLLQEPKLFRKYKAFVIDRPSFQATSCHVSPTKVFHNLLTMKGKAAMEHNGKANGHVMAGEKAGAKPMAKKAMAKKSTAKKAMAKKVMAKKATSKRMAVKPKGAAVKATARRRTKARA